MATPSKDTYSPTTTGDGNTDRNLQAIAGVISSIGDRLKGALQLMVTTVATDVKIGPGAQLVRYIGKGGNRFALPTSRAQGQGVGQLVAVANTGTGSCTIAGDGKDTINGASTLVVQAGSLVVLTSDSAGHWTAVGSVFGASGAAHSIGLVPDPGAAAGATRLLREDGTWATIVIPTPPAVTDVQVFTASGTWTKPAGALHTEAMLIGAGGPGGSGQRGVAGLTRGGGGGGTGGGISAWRWPSSILGATEAVTIGVPVPGPAITVDTTAGTAGVAGADTKFGAWLRAGAGAGGQGGTAGGAGGAGGTPGGTGNLGTGGVGGAGGNGAGAPVAGSVATGRGGGGGGGGGGINNANTGQAAAAGATGTSTVDRPVALTGGGGGAIGTIGTAGAPAATNEAAGGGGSGGGGGATAGAGGAGAAGALYGGGGGGGGASPNGSNSGAGGQGGSGLAIIVTYF